MFFAQQSLTVHITACARIDGGPWKVLALKTVGGGEMAQQLGGHAVLRIQVQFPASTWQLTNLL